MRYKKILMILKRRIESVKDMNKTTKEMISEYITDKTNKFDLVHTDMFTTVSIADALHISRSITSQYLNELCEEDEIYKVKSRPVYFFDGVALEKKFHVSIRNQEFLDMEEMIEYLKRCGNISDVFTSMVGHDGSLKRTIKKCNEVFNYPPDGFSFIIYGNEGCGKQTLAELVCKNSQVKKGILQKGAKIVHRDLSNPDPFLVEKIQSYINEKQNESIVLILSHFEKMTDEISSYLLQFFEKGINKNVHFIFLACTRPDDFLPAELAKYIPVAIHMKDFDEKPKEEKEGIVIALFARESDLLGKNIQICSNVLRALSNRKYENNIDQLSKMIKLICAQAMSRNDDEIIVHTYDLPEEVLENIEITTEDVRYIDCHSYQVSTEINEYLTYFTNVLEASEKKSVAETMDAYNKVYEQMSEKLLRSVGNDRTLRGTEAAISLIVNRVAQKYFINIPGSFSFLIAKLLVVYKENSLQISKWEDEYANALIKTIQKMRRIYVSETMVSDEFSQLLMMNLEEEIPEILKIIMNLTISSYNADFNKNKTFGIVICHGYSTASSIASAVNTMIGSYVFDSIDMPIMTTVEEIKMKLRDKLSRINQHADICIMVDMGSLEKIADDEFAKNRNLAVINNVTTKMALDIGYKIKNAIPIEKFFDNAEEDYKVEYKILKSRKKDAILFTSESGIQTAQRMSNLFYDSLPIEIPVSLQIISFTEAKQEVQKIQEIYNVLFVSGTEDPGVNGIPFIPLQDIITTTNLDLVSTKLSGYLNEDNLKQLIINVRRNFTLMNVLNYLTILNPKPLLDATTAAIDTLQTRRKVNLEGRTLVAIYIHVCILIERLVTKTSVLQNDNATDEFIKNHQDFIQDIHASFKNIELHYSIVIPDSEMKYIYSFFEHEGETK